MITVETTPASTRVTIPTDDVSPDRLRPFLDWLRLEAVARRSQLNEDDGRGSQGAMVGQEQGPIQPAP